MTHIGEETGEEIFHSEKTYQINRNNLAHKDLAGKQFGFEPGAKKQDYDFFHPLVFADVPLIY